jgi:16S rRNA (cytosine1402-N4)-methyltransferase
MSNTYHTSVLLQACIDHLITNPGGTYVDLTFGGGGHSALILKHLDKSGKLLAFDQDVDAQKNALHDSRFTLIPQNFRYLKNFLRVYGVNKVDGILGDLGVSSHQFDEAARGFSIRFDAVLDMRMNQQNPVSARTILQEYDAGELQRLFKTYGELYNAGKVAADICEYRLNNSIETTGDLKTAIARCIPKFEEHKYLAKVFQALRIEVNKEMEVLKECLSQCVELLNPGGRLVVISYHSLEDRLVKNVIKTGNTDGIEEKDIIYGTATKVFKNITGKPIIPDETEIKNNTRARSAKLRVAEKL